MTQSSLERELAALALKIERLARACKNLRCENRQLKEQIAHLTAERDRYLAKTQSARKQIEQLLERLHSLTS